MSAPARGCGGAMRATRVLLGTNYPMGTDLGKKPGEGFQRAPIRSWQNVMMVKPYVERGMPLLYPRWYDDGEHKIDHNYVLFNRPSNHGEKIGVVVETMKGTAVVACRYFVRYKNFAKVVARVQRCWAHDEDSACVVGDVIHIRKAARRGKFKSFQVVSILEPDLEARERLKKDLPARNKPAESLHVTGFKPLFDFSRDKDTNEGEAARAGQLAEDIHRTDADYDGGLADRTGKDKWAFLDADFLSSMEASYETEEAFDDEDAAELEGETYADGAEYDDGNDGDRRPE